MAISGAVDLFYFSWAWSILLLLRESWEGIEGIGLGDHKILNMESRVEWRAGNDRGRAEESCNAWPWPWTLLISNFRNPAGFLKV